jgi:DNA-damage-inducible protein J
MTDVNITVSEERPMTVSYAVRVNESTRDRAAEVARSYGLDLASVTRAFWTQMARTGSIPLSLDYAEPNEASLEAIRETEEIFADNGGRRFGSVEELVQELES